MSEIGGSFSCGNKNNFVDIELNKNQNSENSNCAVDKNRNEIVKCITIAINLPIKCFDLIMSEWKIDKITSEGDIISHTYLPESGRKIFQISGTINYPAMMLINFFYDGIEGMPSWNKHVEESNRICIIDENTDVVYQAAKSYGNGLIGARDFVLLRHRGQVGPYYICGSVSTDFASYPNRQNYIRGENGIGCLAAQSLVEDENKCQLTWILDVKLKGWIPQKIVETCVSLGMVKFMHSLRSRLSAITG